MLALFKKKHKYPEILKLKGILGFKPVNIEFYRQALMHKSCNNYNGEGEQFNNERLEFLGDAILEAVVTDYLFETYKDKTEGFLSKLRASIVKRKMLNALAIQIGLDSFVQHRISSRSYFKHVYGNALEALVGAVFMDKGYEKTRAFIIERLIKKHLDLEKLIIDKSNFKSELIEWVQKNGRTVSFDSYIKYMNLDKIPFFCASAMIDGVVYGEGVGKSKKKAEQNAAEMALNAFKQ